MTSAPGTQQHILLVDDDDYFRVALSKSLRRRGYRIAEAENAEAALHFLKVTEQRPDLVLVDVVMPGMSGIKLAGHIARDYPDVKTLFISGYSFATLEREFDMSPDFLPFFLQKPFGMEALGAKMSEVLAGQAARGSR